MYALYTVPVKIVFIMEKTTANIDRFPIQTLIQDLKKVVRGGGVTGKFWHGHFTIVIDTLFEATSLPDQQLNQLMFMLL